ncbi:MFS general substrate transporter [Dichotomocladium elegans]|nr:MFS general substrate transporter [Dichotomocladium elegans]
MSQSDDCSVSTKIDDALWGDPANPHSWSKKFRWFYTLLVSSLVIAVAFGSSVVTADRTGVIEEFGVSSTVSALQVSLMVFAFAVGPLLWSPLSEKYGRRPMYIIALGIYVIFNIPCAVAKNIETLLVCRFFSGFFASVVLTLAGGTISDLFENEDRGAAIAYFAAAPYAGPVLGPIVGGWVVVGTNSWRWLYWVNMMFIGVMWVVIACLPETYAPVLIKRRDKKLGKAPSIAPSKQSVKDLLCRPFVMLTTEPILMLMSLYIAIIYALLYGFFGSFPIVFHEYFGFNSGITGLMFIGVMIGVFSALLLTPVFEKKYIKSARTPEDRLPCMMFASPFIPIAMFIFGWTSHAHWIGPAIAGIPFGFGMVLVYYSANNYIIDCFSEYCASALAAKTVVRSGGGAAFPLFVGPMYHNLGSQWASTLLAFISLAIVPIPFAFYKWGAQIRARSANATSAPQEKL